MFNIRVVAIRRLRPSPLVPELYQSKRQTTIRVIAIKGPEDFVTSTLSCSPCLWAALAPTTVFDVVGRTAPLDPLMCYAW